MILMLDEYSTGVCKLLCEVSSMMHRWVDSVFFDMLMITFFVLWSYIVVLSAIEKNMLQNCLETF